MMEKGLDDIVKRNIFYKLKGMHLQKCVHFFWVNKLDSLSETSFLAKGRYSFIIDEAPMKVWAYCLKIKDEVLSMFKNSHMSKEREIGKQFKCAMSNIGSEFIGLCSTSSVGGRYFGRTRVL